MSAREVMAKAILDAAMNMGALAHLSSKSFEDKIVDFQIDALAAAGYRILAPGEVDAETVEACAKVADPPLMHRKGRIGLWRKRRAEIATAIRSLGRRA